ncbi:MAG: hypothetical protein ACRDHO_00310 [Actinomycetota bacterium]
MSTKIQALPLPQRQARLSLAGPMAILVVLLTAATLAGYFALRSDEPASRPNAAYENSGVITGTGPGLQSLAGNAAYENSAGITGTGPGLAELARRFAAYRSAGLVSGTGPGLAELRGVDVIVSSSASLWPSVAAIERSIAGSISSASFPSVAAMERWINASSVSDNCGLVRHGPC